MEPQRRISLSQVKDDLGAPEVCPLGHTRQEVRHALFCLLRKRGEAVQFDNNAIGRTIRSLRNKKGISQDVLSGFAGIARTHLTMIENGDKQANFETLWKIANALDMRPSELVAQIEAEIERNS